MAGLRKELGAGEAMALSVALMAPTLSASLNGSGTAALAGRAVPLVMVVSTIGVALVAYAFIKLTREYNHAGSSYALTGMTIGPRAGFFAGFALLGVYLAFCGSTMTATVIFADEFLTGIGVDLGSAGWIIVAILATAGGYLLANREIRIVVRVLLWIEAISILLIIVLSTWVLIKVGAAGNTPSFVNDTGLSAKPFIPGPQGFGAVIAATVLGFFCFAGFEASASLGEETAQPRKYIPIAIGSAVLIGGALFIFSFYAQSVAYGVSAEGVTQYAGTSAPIGDLAEHYIGGWMANLLNFGAFMSAFGCLLGAVTAGARLMFALSRDGFGPRRLSQVSNSGAPTTAVLTAVLFGLVAVVALHGIGSRSISETYFYCGTIGSLLVLVAYAVTSVGAIKLCLSQDRPTKWLDAGLISIGVVFIGYVLYKSCYPVPDSPANLFPYIAGGWLLIGLISVVASPRLAERIGKSLTVEEGFDTKAEV